MDFSSEKKSEISWEYTPHKLCRVLILVKHQINFFLESFLISPTCHPPLILLQGKENKRKKKKRSDSEVTQTIW